MTHVICYYGLVPLVYFILQCFRFFRMSTKRTMRRRDQETDRQTKSIDNETERPTDRQTKSSDNETERPTDRQTDKK